MQVVQSDLSDRRPQLYLPFIPEHEQRVWDAELNRKDVAREKSRLKIAPIKKYKVVQNTNNLLLFALQEADLTERLVGLEANAHELDTESCPYAEALAEDPVVDIEDSVNIWSDRAIEELHEAVLHYSLSVLGARGNSTEKQEVLQWIFAPETFVADLRDAEGNLVEAYLPQSITPFSFNQCCRICGYNPERLMSELEPILDKLKIPRL